MVKGNYEVEQKSYTHRNIWRTSAYLLDLSKSGIERPDYLWLSCLVMSFFAFEAYLNFLGQTIDPQTWKDERNFFKRNPYRGTLGKFQFLTEKCDLAPLDKTQRPYLTLLNLRNTRDFFAHGKFEVIQGNVAAEQGMVPDFLPNFFDKHVNESAAQGALEDLEDLIRKLHSAARLKYEDNSELDSTPVPLLGTVRFELGSWKA